MNPSTASAADTHQQQQAYNHAYSQLYDPQQHSITPQQYPYYATDYTNFYNQQSLHQEPTSIHPPGVPIPSEASNNLPTVDYGQIQLQNQQNYYYSHGIVDGQQQNQWVANDVGGYGPPVPVHNPPIGPSMFRGGGRKTNRPFRGRGRGRGRGQYGSSSKGTTAHIQGQGQGQGQVSQPFMAWCELCRVDCTTFEILENHKNGKRHKKNLQVHQELQNLNNVISNRQNYENPIPEAENQQPASENSPLGPVNEDKRKRMASSSNGLKKRKKTVKKPKEFVHLICDLCNVTCESQVVLDSHLAGKKHISNLKRFPSSSFTPQIAAAPIPVKEPDHQQDSTATVTANESSATEEPDKNGQQSSIMNEA